VTTAEKPTPESRNYKQLRETSTDDPAKLWAQVKMSDSDAEVKLARMFLEGTGVAQNCAQAELLLLDASRKGNSQASSLLSDHPCQ
jgi:TPR repeat protein